jgi:hypothetical protein
MPNSAHFAIRSAVAARLLTSPALASGNVRVGTRRPMAQAVNAQVHVDLDESAATGAGMNTTEWSTRIRVECIARETATAADLGADALVTSVHDRLMADPTLNGLAINTSPAGIAWTPDDEADASLAVCQALFVVRHRTARASVAAL